MMGCGRKEGRKSREERSGGRKDRGKDLRNDGRKREGGKEGKIESRED